MTKISKQRKCFGKWLMQYGTVMKRIFATGIKLRLKVRDLKLENILLDKNLNVKVIDFGFTRNTENNKLLDTFCGSPAYAAPEIISAKKYSGKSADVWSLGVIFFTMVAGYLPFDEDDEKEMHKKVLGMEYTIPPNLHVGTYF
jgi:serine/threonine protein kinase